PEVLFSNLTKVSSVRPFIMQQRDGLAIVFYPTSPSRKLLQFHTWITEYDLKYHHSFTETIPTTSIATISSSQKTQEERIGKDGFSKVPHELMMIIMDNLEATDILSLSMVNKKLRAHTQDNYLWRQILIRNYGESVIKDEPKHPSRRLKWKRTKRNKQPQVEPNWQKVFMKLSTVKVSTKTAISRGKPGAYY
ncbi:7568_t:CDS:2, partial [Dentiscutata heterogama]